MALSKYARASKIDAYPSELKRKFSNAVSTLASCIDETKAFTAFMHANPNLEFEQVDRDKYSDMFVSAVTELMAVVGSLQSLNDLENGVISPEDFVASYGLDVAEYSKRFD